METIKNIFYVFLALIAIGIVVGLLALATVAGGFLMLMVLGIGTVWFIAWIIKSWFEPKN
jgi:hypothetical protein